LSKHTRCVLDGESQCSFLAKSIIDELRREVIDHRGLTVTAFETYSPVSSPRIYVRFSMKGIWTNSSTPVLAFESTRTFSSHPAVPHDVNLLERTRKLQLAELKDDSEDLPIEFLTKGDRYWKIVKDTSPIHLSPCVELLSSKLGSILSRNLLLKTCWRRAQFTL
jgi:hypothetical protein